MLRPLVMFLVLGAPALALAQPGADPTAPPPPAGPPPGPYDPNAGAAPYDPNAGAGPYAPPPPAGPPQPYGPAPYGQPYGQPPPPPPPPRLRSGMTVELNLGIGWIRLAAEGQSETSDLGVGGLCFGLGGWVGPNTAISGRIAGVTLSENDETFSAIFAGPSVQHWVNDHFWFGGGIGFAILSSSEQGDDSINGFGLDARVGYTFNAGNENTFNASMELTPGFYEENGVDATFTGIAFMLGYQHL